MAALYSFQSIINPITKLTFSMSKNLFATKSVDKLIRESESGDHTLKRTLTATNLTMLGIGAIIGTGIFVLTGSAAAQFAGPGLVISFMIAGGVLFAFSFMTTRIAAKGLQAAMLEMLLITAISLFIYFLAFRLGVFNKHKHTPGFDQDLQELEQLKEMAKELE